MSRIIIVTGPAGAGKSTACEAFAETAEGTWAFVSQDHIRTFIKAGYKNPSETWTDETHSQWDASQAICGDMLHRYQAAGINCILDCFAPKGSFDKWEKVLDDLEYKLIVLLPHVDNAIARNAQRTGAAYVRKADIRGHHEWFSAWKDDERVTIIDTSDLSVEATIEKIKQLTN